MSLVVQVAQGFVHDAAMGLVLLEGYTFQMSKCGMLILCGDCLTVVKVDLAAKVELQLHWRAQQRGTVWQRAWIRHALFARDL